MTSFYDILFYTLVLTQSFFMLIFYIYYQNSFKNFEKFLNGEFICVRCDKKLHACSFFGYGKIVCPDCYTYDDLYTWLRPDMTYWLNRLFHGEDKDGYYYKLFNKWMYIKC